MSDRGILHPKCGKRFSSGNTIGHCGACCLTFVGLLAFDMHRRGGRCTPPSSEGMSWIDDKGYWHYSSRMTEERKTQMNAATTTGTSPA